MHFIGTMKKSLLLITSIALLFASCDPALPEEEPTEAEKQMVTTEMTWQLDSVLVVRNYLQVGESKKMLHPEDGIDIWSYTMYPCSYSFPEDLYFINEYSGEVISLYKEFNKGYCKYICTYNNNVISGGYLCYYRNFFTFSGVGRGGWVEFMLREASTNWDTEVWTCTYNSEEDYNTGEVIERRVEFYSRTK